MNSTLAFVGRSDSQPTARAVLRIGDDRLHTATWGDGPATILMLHEGLGSIDGWKGVPAAVATATGETVLAYDRAGHGRSTPTPTGPWPTRWLHHEAALLGKLIGAVTESAPLLVGHSDGGSIALIAAAEQHCSPRGLVTLAAHSWVEPVCFESIVGMRNNAEAFVARLGRSHAAAAQLFEAWSGVWVSADFQSWDIRPQLAAIACPALIAQGSNDEYASQAHVLATAQAIGPHAQSRLLQGLGHLLHHEDEQAVVETIVDFATDTAPPATH